MISRDVPIHFSIDLKQIDDMKPGCECEFIDWKFSYISDAYPKQFPLHWILNYPKDILKPKSPKWRL